MDSARYFLRTMVDEDLAAYARIHNRHLPSEHLSAEQIRHYHRMYDHPGGFRELLAIEERSSGALAAGATVFQFPGAFRIWIWVDLDHEGRGIGRELLDAVERTARARGAKALWADIRADDSRALRFAASAGFVEKRRRWTSRLDLDPLPTTGLATTPSAGRRRDVQLTTLAAEGPDQVEVRERFYRLFCDAMLDAPSMGRTPPPTFDQFEEQLLRAPGYLPEAIFIAKIGGEYVAFTTLEAPPENSDTAQVGDTGTARTYRNRGLATALKREAIRFAKSRGYRFLETHNDSLNTPIWAINAKLGFRQRETTIQEEKVLEPSHSRG